MPAATPPSRQATLLLPSPERLGTPVIDAAVARALGRADRLAPGDPGEQAQLLRHFDLLPRGWPVAGSSETRARMPSYFGS